MIKKVIGYSVLFGLLIFSKESGSFEETFFVDVGYCQNDNAYIASCQGIDARNATDIIFAYDIRQSEVLRIINSNLPTIPEGIFALDTLVSDVQITNVSLQHIPKPAFQRGDRLKYLDLSANKIKNLSEGVFGNLKQLIELKLSSNNLKTLPEDILLGKPQLYILNISRNEIQYLGENTFSESVSLQFIDISYNQLKSIEPNTFKGLHIIELDLSSNLFNGTTLKFLMGINVTSLNLNGNCLESVPLEIFGSNQGLEGLHLSRTCLRDLQYGTFPSSLKFLDISNNNLEDFQSDVLVTSPKLRNLNVEHSQVSYYHLYNLVNALSLDTIHFDGNDMVCNSLSSIIRAARRANIKYTVTNPVFNKTNIEGIQCIAPHIVF